jgi:hypothetical protein
LKSLITWSHVEICWVSKKEQDWWHMEQNFFFSSSHPQNTNKCQNLPNHRLILIKFQFPTITNAFNFNVHFHALMLNYDRFLCNMNIHIMSFSIINLATHKYAHKSFWLRYFLKCQTQNFLSSAAQKLEDGNWEKNTNFYLKQSKVLSSFRNAIYQIIKKLDLWRKLWIFLLRFKVLHEILGKNSYKNNNETRNE